MIKQIVNHIQTGELMHNCVDRASLKTIGGALWLNVHDPRICSDIRTSLLTDEPIVVDGIGYAVREMMPRVGEATGTFRVERA
jgi:hypothetical protein